ncbi:hypothetical protein PO909_016944 [Leuciscus waleckii]
MADWKIPVSYNFNPSYHAYAYGLMYPQVSEHGHPNLNWAEAAYAQSGGVTASYYSAQTTQQSPPWSPENGNTSNYGNYPSHTQNGRLFISYNKTEPEPKVKDAEQASSDTPSDTESHTPDSWSSGSSREGGALTDLNHPSWKDRDYETDSGSPDNGEPVSNSVSAEGEEPRYLTPAEMKTLAGGTGLTYKQVKTWFQNRRMKLKRHQRDSSWMTERYVVNAVPNTSAAHSQTETARANQDHYSNPQVREPLFKRSPQQTPFYPSYPQPRSPPQATARPPGNWPLPPAVTHYEFPNPTSYMQARAGGNAVNKGSSPTQMASMPSAQWSTKGMTLL